MGERACVGFVGNEVMCKADKVLVLVVVVKRCMTMSIKVTSVTIDLSIYIGALRFASKWSRCSLDVRCQVNQSDRNYF